MVNKEILDPQEQQDLKVSLDLTERAANKEQQERLETQERLDLQAILELLD
tara:strand:+ start:100 stop:252 length:153 start_codon:yes stop_codon:yes gene_type:complete